MLKIANANSAGDCKLVGKIGVATDPDDPLAYLVTAKLRFELGSESDAEAWEGTGSDPILPGITKLYGYANVENTNRKWDLKLRDSVSLIVELIPQRGHEQAGEGYRGGLDLTSAKATLSKAASTVDCSVRMGGVKKEQIEHITQLLRGLVNINTENRQTAIPFPGPGKKAANGD